MILPWLLLSGCAHTVSIVSDPIGAVVSVDGERAGVTPYTFLARGRQSVTVELVGYRTLTLTTGPGSPKTVEVRMMPEHGGVGTWTPPDAR